MPHQVLGEDVGAFVVLQARRDARRRRRSLAFCAERLADYKRPRQLRFVAELPRNATGKVMKHKLVDRRSRHDRSGRASLARPYLTLDVIQEGTVALTELKGSKSGTQKVRIERGPVRVFAQALMDDDPVYDGDDAPVPPTFPFVMPFWGSLGLGRRRRPADREAAGQGPGDPARRAGVRVHPLTRRSATCSRASRRSTDVYEKETVERRQARVLRDRDHLEGRRHRRPVCTSNIFTLVINVRPPKD